MLREYAPDNRNALWNCTWSFFLCYSDEVNYIFMCTLLATHMESC